MSTVYTKPGHWISISHQKDGQTMVNAYMDRASVSIYDLSAKQCREIARALLDEANRQDQAKHDDERLHAALAADEMKEAA